MTAFRFLHHQPRQRARQLRWVLPASVVVAVATFAALAATYLVSDRAVEAEFFRAHKTIAHTGELVRDGVLVGAAVLMLLVVGLTAWAFRVTHRIVRPVHAVHRALEALVAGELGVRVELRRDDEFHEIGETLNSLAAGLASTLGRVHALVDEIVALLAEDSDDVPAWPAAARLEQLARELDGAIEVFRSEPRRVIRENGS